MRGQYRGRTATYVQAWECEGPVFGGYVYDQTIALNKLGEGCDVRSVTIVRHDNGEREYLPGTIAASVYTHRERWIA